MVLHYSAPTKSHSKSGIAFLALPNEVLWSLSRNIEMSYLFSDSAKTIRIDTLPSFFWTQKSVPASHKGKRDTTRLFLAELKILLLSKWRVPNTSYRFGAIKAFIVETRIVVLFDFEMHKMKWEKKKFQPSLFKNVTLYN